MSQELVEAQSGISVQNDRADNSRMLLEVPGLAEKTTVQLGNCIFIPKLEDDTDKELHFLNIDIDGKPQLFCKPRHAATRPSLTVTPGEAFDFTGTNFLFRHGGIPLPYKQAAVSLALYRQDVSLLEIALAPHEVIECLPFYMGRLGLDQQDLPRLLESLPMLRGHGYYDLPHL